MRLRSLLIAAFISLLIAACAPKTAAPPPPPTAPAAGPAPEFVAMAAAPASLSGKKFDPPCDVPFGSIGEVRDIDDTCGIEGEGSDKSKLQNKAKNNFCASGTPVNFNRQLGERLNTALDNLPNFTWGGPTALPADRSPLKNIITVSGKGVGEGSLVRSVLYFMHANYSNTGKGENVNCTTPGRASNDIHVYLSLTPGEDDRCESINAEITPHFRPEAWEDMVGLEINENRPLRVTGQLMLDASHKPCKGTHRSSPARFTSWEIHPVYNIEVCRYKTKSKCTLSGAEPWIPFDEWLGEDEHDGGAPIASLLSRKHSAVTLVLPR